MRVNLQAADPIVDLKRDADTVPKARDPDVPAFTREVGSIAGVQDVHGVPTFEGLGV